MKILSIDGALLGVQSVASGSGWQVNVEGLDAGVYILEITDDKEAMARLPLVVK